MRMPRFRRSMGAPDYNRALNACMTQLERQYFVLDFGSDLREGYGRRVLNGKEMVTVTEGPGERGTLTCITYTRSRLFGKPRETIFMTERYLTRKTRRIQVNKGKEILCRDVSDLADFMRVHPGSFDYLFDDMRHATRLLAAYEARSQPRLPAAAVRMLYPRARRATAVVAGLAVAGMLGLGAAYIHTKRNEAQLKKELVGSLLREAGLAVELHKQQQWQLTLEAILESLGLRVVPHPGFPGTPKSEPAVPLHPTQEDLNDILKERADGEREIF